MMQSERLENSFAFAFYLDFFFPLDLSSHMRVLPYQHLTFFSCFGCPHPCLLYCQAVYLNVHTSTSLNWFRDAFPRKAYFHGCRLLGQAYSLLFGMDFGFACIRILRDFLALNTLDFMGWGVHTPDLA